MEIRADIAELMDMCDGCSRCVDVCTSHAKGGCNPLEVMEGKLESARGCVGCGMCNRVCEYTVPKKVMMYANCTVNGMAPPQVYRDTGYNLPGSQTEDVPQPGYTDGAEAQLMPGCQVNAFAPYLEYATEKVLRHIGIGTERFEGGCCTYPVPFRGMDDDERDSVKRRISAPLKGRKLYTICPGCADEMSSSGIDAEHIIYRIHENLDALRGLKRLNLRVALQPGCNLRSEYARFRDIAEVLGCQIADVRQGCCGKMVPVISERIMSERQEDMKGVDAVVVGCPSCFARYDAYPDGIPVLYITELILLAMGDGSTVRLHRAPVRL